MDWCRYAAVSSGILGLLGAGLVCQLADGIVLGAVVPYDAIITPSRPSASCHRLVTVHLPLRYKQGDASTLGTRLLRPLEAAGSASLSQLPTLRLR